MEGLLHTVCLLLQIRLMMRYLNIPKVPHWCPFFQYYRSFIPYHCCIKINCIIDIINFMIAVSTTRHLSLFERPRSFFGYYFEPHFFIALNVIRRSVDLRHSNLWMFFILFLRIIIFMRSVLWGVFHTAHTVKWYYSMINGGTIDSKSFHVYVYKKSSMHFTTQKK